MQVIKAYRLKLYPNQEQSQHFLQVAGSCRFVWNYYLNKQKEDYLNGVKTSCYSNCKDLTALKKISEYAWLDDIQVHFLQQSLRDLDKAYSKFFKKIANFPKFKSRHSTKPSFRKPTGWKLDGNKLLIERGISVRTRGKLPPENAKLTSVTISRNPSGNWYVSIVATEEINPTPKTGAPIGLDLGLTHLAIISDGRKFEAKKPRKKLQKHMKAIQQSLSRKQKGSNGRGEVKLKLARLNQKIKNQRANYLHQVSHQLASENQAVIVVEDLAVKNLMANHSLAGAIADSGWAEFVRQLEYKQLWSGGTVEKVDRFFPSSKMCSNCSYIVGKLSLNIREWACPKCSIEHDRDTNAAKNLVKQWLGNSQAWRQERVAESLETARVTRPVKRGRRKLGTVSI